MKASRQPASEPAAPRLWSRPRLSLLQIWNMCFGLFGVQIVWGLQNANTSRIFQTLGADVAELPILWIAGPAAGLLVQPIIGHLSDRTWGPLGRRRPYLLGGALLTAIALVVMPNVSALWAASLMLWVLTASINIAMEPFRALVADTLPEEQRTAGFAIQVFFIGLGAVFASALPWMLANWAGVSNDATHGLPQSVRLAFYIGSFCLLAAVVWTVLTTRERPPEMQQVTEAVLVPGAAAVAALIRHGTIWVVGGALVGGASVLFGWEREIYVLAASAAAFGVAQLVTAWMRRRGDAALGLLEIVEDIIHMPLLLKRLALVQFFTWFALFAMWIYTIPAVAQRHYHTSDAASRAYNEAADWVGVLFAGYNGVAALVALLLPMVAARIGRPFTHSLCLLAGAAGLIGLIAIRDAGMLWLPMVGIGIAWAAILSMPYAMLASAVPPQKTGVYMGIHNIFLVLPQLFAATILGPLVGRVFGGQATLALALSAGALGLAALCTLAIPRSGEGALAR